MNSPGQARTAGWARLVGEERISPPNRGNYAYVKNPDTTAGLQCEPGVAVAGVVALALALFVLAVVLLAYGLWFPVAVPPPVAIAPMVLAYFVRFLVQERRPRRVQNA